MMVVPFRFAAPVYAIVVVTNCGICTITLIVGVVVGLPVGETTVVLVMLPVYRVVTVTVVGGGRVG